MHFMYGTVLHMPKQQEAPDGDGDHRQSSCEDHTFCGGYLIRMVFCRQDRSGAACGGRGEQGADSGDQSVLASQPAAEKYNGWYDDKTYGGEINLIPVQDRLIIHIHENCADVDHGKSRTAVTQAEDGILDDSGKLDIQHHDGETHVSGQHTRMGEYFFIKFFFIRRSLKERYPCGPHDNSLGNQKDRGVHEACVAEYAFCQGISHKSRVGADGTVLIYTAFTVGHSVIAELSDDQAEYLDQNGGGQQLGEFQQKIAVELCRECFNNVAGEDYVQNDIHETFLSGFCDFIGSAQEKANDDQQEHHPHQRK